MDDDRRHPWGDDYQRQLDQIRSENYVRRPPPPIDYNRPYTQWFTPTPIPSSILSMVESRLEAYRASKAIHDREPLWLSESLQDHTEPAINHIIPTAVESVLEPTAITHAAPSSIPTTTETASNSIIAALTRLYTRFRCSAWPVSLLLELAILCFLLHTATSLFRIFIYERWNPETKPTSSRHPGSTQSASEMPKYSEVRISYLQRLRGVAGCSLDRPPERPQHHGLKDTLCRAGFDLVTETSLPGIYIFSVFVHLVRCALHRTMYSDNLESTSDDTPTAEHHIPAFLANIAMITACTQFALQCAVACLSMCIYGLIYVIRMLDESLGFTSAAVFSPYRTASRSESARNHVHGSRLVLRLSFHMLAAVSIIYATSWIHNTGAEQMRQWWEDYTSPPMDVVFRPSWEVEGNGGWLPLWLGAGPTVTWHRTETILSTETTTVTAIEATEVTITELATMTRTDIKTRVETVTRPDTPVMTETATRTIQVFYQPHSGGTIGTTKNETWKYAAGDGLRYCSVCKQRHCCKHLLH